jgi:NitT/TauT family transport system ATP-binding protein
VPPLFEIKNAGKKFNDRWLFKNLNLNVNPGDFVSILGPSGCGKSTLLRIIAGLDKFSEGSLVNKSSSTPGFVFQESCLLPWLTVFENINIGIADLKLSKEDKKSQILKMLDVVKLKDAIDLFPHQLSGGMKMRVSIARALVNNKSVLFMDEPFAALDDFIRFELQEELLDYWKQHNMTVFFVTHSVNESVFLSQKLWLFPQGNVKEFSEIDLKKSFQDPVQYRNSSDYFKLTSEISSRLRGGK